MLRDSIKQKKGQKQKVLGEKIGMGFSVFILLIKGILFFAVPKTEAFETAAKFIKSNPEINARTGAVQSIFLVPLGGMSMTTSAQGSAGQADLHFIVKGAERYIDLNLLLNKDFETNWQVEIN